MEGRIAMLRRARIPAATACVVMAMAGCASRRPATAPPVSERPLAPTEREQAVDVSMRRLEALAAEQARHPWTGGATAPLPPGVEPVLGQVVTAADDPKALMELDRVIAEVAAEHPEGAAEHGEIEPEAAESALRLYVSGRQRAIEGDAAGALQDLRTATTLDPTAGEPWRELGEAYLLTGSRSEAAKAFQNAAARGLNDPRALELLGRWALDRGENRTAAVYLARASLAWPERTDPLLAQVIEVTLWRALAADGYLLASRDMLQRALSRQTQLSSSTRYANEAGAIFRRQGDLWRAIGDADCRLGQYDAAARAYERADDLPSLDGQDVTSRRALALVRCGRPAEAAVAVLRDMMGSGGRPAAESVDQLRYLATTAGLSGPISEAIESFRRTASPPGSIAGGLARAQAAVAGGDRARQILREQASQHPADLAAATNLFNLIADPHAVASEAARLAGEHPAAAGRVAESLLRSSVPIEPLIAGLDRAVPADAAGLLLIYLEAARGDVHAAADRAARLRAAARSAAPALLAQVEMGLLAGRTDLAQDACTRLNAVVTADAGRLRARGLAWLQRDRAALAVLEPVLAAPTTSADERLDDLLLGGDLAVVLSRPDDAERWFRQAAELDPFDDRAVGRLLRLYSPEGAKADPAKLNQLIRDLRQNMPDSRAMRAARIRDQVRRSVLAPAEEQALRLIAEDPSDSSLIELLTSVWRARAQAGDAEALGRGVTWIESQLGRRPHSPVLLAGLTMLMIEQHRERDAEGRLRAALDSSGHPEVSRLLEKLLRDQLGEGGEADALALKRLEKPVRSPVEALELAELYSRQERDTEAAATLSTALTPDVTLAPEQDLRVLLIMSRAAQRAVEHSDQAVLAAAAGLFDLAEARSMKLSWEMHEARFEVLARLATADAARVLGAVHRAAAEYAARAVPAYVMAAQKLADAGHGPVANAVMAAAADESSSAGVDLLQAWMVVAFKAGTIADVRTVIDRAARDGKARELAERLAGERQAETPRDWRAELAYIMGQFYNAEQRHELANAAYELALEYDPEHAWACNNLGYALADQGVEIERASALLERAHAALPDQAAVTDSLGWLRYKQGVIIDKTDPATGRVLRAGAVGLLQSAAETARGQDDPTIQDHYGDALWLAGRAQEAIRAWQRAEMISSRELARRRGERDGGLTAAARQEFETLRKSSIEKRRAAAAGQEVRVAPQLGTESPRPVGQPTGGSLAPGGAAAGQAQKQE
jgi:tetratricopeptide (TPR) repeat protein